MNDRLRELIARKRAEGEASHASINALYQRWADQLQDILDAAASQQVPSVEPKDETGWLIERGGLCIGFCEHKMKWVTLTDDQALRFCRRSDAIRFIEAFRTEMDLENVLVHDHLWAASLNRQLKTPHGDSDQRSQAQSGVAWRCWKVR